MTIKQLGGVFGRNPTFNDVTIEGELTFDGDIDINSDLTVDGNLLVKGTTTSENSVIVTGGITGHGANRTTLSQEGGGAGYWQSYGADAATKGLFVLRQASSDFSVNNIPLAIFPSGGANFGGYVDAGAGNVRIADGNLVIGTSGKGIDFSATAGTGTSELFDDYEEGDFSVTSPTAEVVLNANTCKYTKVGRKVTCSGAISVASIGAPTGNVDFGGFPFTSANVDGADISVDIYTYGWKTSMTTSVMGAMSRNATGFFLQKTNGAGSVAVLSGDVQAGTVIWFSVSYIVA